MGTGVAFALGAYGIWGLLPAYFKLVETVPAGAMLAHRIVWSFVLVGIYLALRGRTGEVIAILRQPRMVGVLFLSATVIGVNWLLFIWAVGNSHVLDASLGYFINPLLSILTGLVVLKERLSRPQLVAVLLAALAVVTKTIMLGTLPWISLLLALSFCVYGYIRKVAPVGATAGMMVEVVLLLPFAIIYLVGFVPETLTPAGLGPWWMYPALIASGIVTAVPLVFFAAAARRLPLVIIGMLQYLAPSLQFLQAVFIWNEPLDRAELLTFVVIWVALLVLTFDSWRRWRQDHAQRRGA